MNRYIYYVALLLLVSASGCMMGPNFQKPVVNSPEKFRFDSLRADTVLNLKWWELFNDKHLKALIDTALKYNKDVQIAASRVEEARAVVGYKKADQYPSFGYEMSVQGANFEPIGQNGNPGANYSISPNLNWEIDFWGKYRRGTEAAKAEMLASQYAQRAVMISLISEVAGTYFLLLDYNSRLEIAEQTLVSRLEGLKIMQSKFDYGTIPELELNQAQINEAIAASAVPAFERRIAQTEHGLSILLGQNPGSFPGISNLQEQNLPPDIPAGIPSNILERRPDIMVAEQQLAAQTARIGVAQAMRLPNISLTGLFGSSSSELSAILSKSSVVWMAAATLTGPVFNFGKNKRRVEIERQRTEQALLQYEKTVLQAFRDVEDALVEVNTYGKEFKAVSRQKKAATNATLLSQERYYGGVTSYLEVLDSERSLFNADLAASETYQLHLNSYVKLYKALGGGWISEEEENQAGQATNNQ